ncbi:MAG: hypothetical protein OHK0046_11630 [Anaerolineae bacterium]
MLGIDLIVPIALKDFVGSRGGILRAFRESLKTYHEVWFPITLCVFIVPNSGTFAEFPHSIERRC